MRKWTRVFGILFCLAVACVLVFSSVKLRQEDLADRERLQEISRQYDEEFLPLKNRQSELKAGLEALEEQYLSGADRRGTIVILCTAPDARIMTDIAPALQAAAFPGVIAVGENAMPNDSGCLTAEEVGELLDDGWELCYLMEERTDLQSIRAELQLMGLPSPECAYFPDSDCNSSRESALEEQNVQTVIQRRKSYGRNCGDALVHISAMGSFETGVKDACINALSASDAMVVTVGYTEQHELYLEDNFSKMLKSLQDMTDGTQAFVGTASEAYREKRSTEGISPEEEQRYLEQRAAMQEELETVEREMQTIQSQGMNR